MFLAGMGLILRYLTLPLLLNTCFDFPPDHGYY
jgi:hypothetical protein